MAISIQGTVEGGDDNADINVYDQLQWEQIDGPAAMVAFEYSEEAVAYIPGNAPDDAQLTFRLTARLGDVESTADYTVTVLPADTTGSMDEATDLVALGASTMAGAGNNEVWLGTDTGTLARAGMEGISFTEELGSRITTILPIDNGLTLIAQPDAGVVSQYNQNNMLVSPFLTELSGGGTLGPISTIAIDNDNNLYMGTEDNRIVLYDSPDGAEPAVTVSLYSLTETPTALALGQVPVSPDIDQNDEGNVLYYGTAAGNIKQIGLTPAEVAGGPEVGTPLPYVSIPGSGAVISVSVDPQGNMWVAKSSGLYLVRRLPDADPVVERTVVAPAGLAGYASLRAGDNSLSWIDPSSGRVANLQTIQN
jgi:sugar lactone lactonase YvrE